MTKNEKLALLEDIFEVDEGTLKDGMKLGEMEQWDSMTKLSLIALIDDECNKKLSGEKIRGFETINDILDFME